MMTFIVGENRRDRSCQRKKKRRSENNRGDLHGNPDDCESRRSTKGWSIRERGENTTGEIVHPSTRCVQMVIHTLNRRTSMTRPVTSGFRLIGKETERGWEQDDDVSTLLPSLVRYENHTVAGEQLRQRSLQSPLDVLERKTGLSRHTLVRARRGQEMRKQS